MELIDQYLHHLSHLDIKLWADGERLRCSAPKGVLTQALQQEIGARKAEILAFLHSNQQQEKNNNLQIRPVSRGDPLPLSFAQQRLWFLEQLDGGSLAYIISGGVRLIGQLDVDLLQQIFDEIVQRHEILRTTFPNIDGQPIQQIATTIKVPLQIIDLRHLSMAAAQIEEDRIFTQESLRPFDLQKGPLLRLMLIRLPSSLTTVLQRDSHPPKSVSSYTLLVTMHHIIADGWSVDLLVQEGAARYAAYLSARTSEIAPLPLWSPLPIQYVDYAVWQRQQLQSGALDHQLRYWQQQLLGPSGSLPSPLVLPTDRPRPPVQSFRGALEPFQVGEELTAPLTKLSRQLGASMFITLHAAFALLLARYSNRNDIVVGTPIANRNRHEIESLIGYFANTLAIRIDLSENPTFMELVAQTRQHTLDAQSHQDIPIEHLVDALAPQRDLSYSPLFQVMFVWRHARQESIQLPELTVTLFEPASHTAKFDLTLFLEENGPGRQPEVAAGMGLEGAFEYNTDLFDRTTIQRFVRHFQTLLAEIVVRPEQRVSDYSLLTSDERHQMLVRWNETQSAYKVERCFHELFEAQAKHTPNAIAVDYQGQCLTYNQLNNRANRLAHYLLSRVAVLQGSKVSKPDASETLIGICMTRSIDLVISLLAVLKAGCAYIPLDPANPDERLAFMIEDADLDIILTDHQLAQRLPQVDHPILLDREQSKIEAQAVSKPPIEIKLDNAAYVIYTSGSTGKPKGVLIEHRGLSNYLMWAVEAYAVADGVGAPVSTAIGFDATITSLFTPLLVGKTVFLLPEEDEIEALSALLCAEKQLSLLKVTPAHLTVLKEEISGQMLTNSANAFIIGGEALFESHLEFWRTHAPHTRLINEYGPTETVVGCCIYDASATQSDKSAQGGSTNAIPIGRPIANTQLYILDKGLQPVPVGVPGELYIGGVGVARGYLNRPALTCERFIQSPFSSDPKARLYKTGDLARYLPTKDDTPAQIEYLGRLDHQVKIRGYRIELGEIEAVLGKHPQIREFAVIDREDQPGQKQLVAYYVTETADLLDENLSTSLRTYLKQKLPDYMIPVSFIQLATLPLTTNGKVDRNALPAPDDRQRQSDYVAPKTAIEQTLASIWQEVLGVEQVGRHDNFFELRGDSISSIQVVSRAKQQGIHLTVKQIFQNQHLATLATVAEPDTIVQVDQGLVSGAVPLTPIQQWFFEQKHAAPHHYNQSILLKTIDDLNTDYLESAFQSLVIHHDALRLRFINRDGDGWIQRHEEPTKTPILSQIKLANLSEEVAHNILHTTVEMIQAQLDLSVGPLLRAVLIQRDQNQSAWLFVTIHHLVVDGLSWRILLEDLQTAYGQAMMGKEISLPAKTSSFKAWSESVSRYAQERAVQEELSYWLADRWQRVDLLPIDDGKHRDNTVASEQALSVTLSAEQTQQLLQLNIPNLHINDILLTALLRTLTIHTGITHLLIDLEGHGREPLFDDLDISRTVGWFTNIYPVLLHVDQEQFDDISAMLHTVHAQLHQIPNKGIGYGLLRYLPVNAEQRSRLAALPQAQILFNYLGQFNANQSALSYFSLLQDGCHAERNPRQHRRYLFEINGLVVHGELNLRWHYSKNYHTHDEVAQLAHTFIHELVKLLDLCYGGELISISPKQVESSPLSFAQERLWMMEQLEDLSSIYNEPRAVRLTGSLDIATLEQAFQHLIDRHESLRTSFHEQDHQPIQVVAPALPFTLSVIDLRQERLAQPSQVERWIQQESRYLFDLSQAPLMRATLLQLAPTDGEPTYILILVLHHIICDGWSIEILIREVVSLYESFAQGQPSPFEPLSHQYTDYTRWQRRTLQGDRMKKTVNYWQQQLAGMPNQLQLPTDRPYPAIQSFEGAICSFEISPILANRLKMLAQAEDATLFMVLLAAYKSLLYRLTGQTDIVVGTSFAGRTRPEWESIIGIFINVLPLRTQFLTNIPEERTFQTLLRQIRDNTVDAYAHEELTFGKLVEVLRPPRDPRYMPVVQSLFVFDNFPMSSNEIHNLKIEPLEIDGGTARFDLALFMVEKPATEGNPAKKADRGLVGNWRYKCSLFDTETLDKISKYLITILEQVVNQPDIQLDAIEILSEAEKREKSVQKRERELSKRKRLRRVERKPVALS